MKKYRVYVHGRNFILRIDEKVKNMGFYTTRYVEAEDDQVAELKAIELIKSDDGLKQTVLNTMENPPMLYAEEIVELENFDGIMTPGTGYTWYEHNEDLEKDNSANKRL